MPIHNFRTYLITDRSWSLGAVYMPLERLVKKGFVSTQMSESTPRRGGRQKRMYALTNEGKHALIQIHEVDRAMWVGIPKLTVDTSAR